MTDVIDRATLGLDASVPTDILSPFYYEGDILAEPLDIRAGVAFAPDGPGLGIELDEASLERYADR